MSIIKLGLPLIDIKGGFGGVYFHRDKSGLHCCSKPRSIYRKSTSQSIQRNAFSAARAYSTDPRFVSYNIYRILNGLEPADPPESYTIPNL